MTTMTLTNSPMVSFQETAAQHQLWQHPFITRAKLKCLTLHEVKALAVQMYQFSKSFNRILASAIAHCPDDEAQFVILENLFDEMGEGDISKAHPNLFRRFTRALGISDLELDGADPTPETQQLIETYLNLAPTYGYLAALGGICYASEGIVNTLYRHLQDGIEQVICFAREDLIFFDLHIDLDEDHAAHLAQLIQPRLSSIRDHDQINHAIHIAMNARCHFFDGVQRHAQTLQELEAP